MFCCSLNCIPALSPLSLSHTHARARTHTRTLSLSLSLSLSEEVSHTSPPPHSQNTHTYTHTHTFSLSLSEEVSHTSPPPHSQNTHTHTHTCRHMHTHTHACAFETSPNFLQCKLWCFVCSYIEWIDGLELMFKAIPSCQSFRDKFFWCIFHCYLFGSLYHCHCASSTLCFLPRSVLFLVPLRVVVIHLYQEHQNKNYYHLIIHAFSFR